MVRALLLTAGMLTAIAGVRADDKPLDRGEIDKRAYKLAYDTALKGTELYNVAKDQAGCLRLYEGAVPALAAFLDHRPELAKTIAAQLAEADRLATVKDKAFALRKALDAVMEQTGEKAALKKPLWERLGGEKAVRAVIHDFVLAAAPDPKVDFFRGGKFPLDAKGVEKLEQYLVELVSATTGGPLKYTGRDMKSSHKGMKITEAEFTALAGHLVATLKKYKVPQAEIDELVGIVAGTAKDIVEVKK